jgi:hypothetical protein
MLRAARAAPARLLSMSGSVTKASSVVRCYLEVDQWLGSRCAGMAASRRLKAKTKISGGG